MQPDRAVEPGTPEWEAWCAEQDTKAAAYVEARRAYMEAMGWPWPRRVRKAKRPHPGLIDYADAEDG